MNFMNKYRDETYALLRIVTGFLFAFHGIQITFGYHMDPAMKPALLSQGGIGGLIELLGGLMVMLGWQTRLAAFICSGTMAVAYFQFHWKGQMDANFFPALNQGEPAVLYCFIFLFIAAQGNGKWSLKK